MASRQQVRATAKRQGRQVVAVRRQAIRTAQKKIQMKANSLASNIASWSSPTDDGRRFDPINYRDSRRSLNDLAISWGTAVVNPLVDGVDAVRDLAEEHAVEGLGLVGVDIDADEIEEPEDYDPEDAITGLVAAPKRGLAAQLATLAGAVLTGVLLADLARQIGASSESVDDIADVYTARAANRAASLLSFELSDEYGERKQTIFENTDEQDLQKQWQTIDEGCLRTCAPMNEQVVDLDDVFVTGEGDEVDQEPAHPNCDCVVMPYLAKAPETADASETPAD